MLLIYSILLVFVSLVISPAEITSIPLRTDYYRSSSNPAICLELFHFYPTGPLNIYGEFYYERDIIYRDDKPKKIKTKYSFIRVNTPCETSSIFSTYRDNFKIILIIITLSLARDSNKFSYFNYKLFNGTKSRIYELWDMNKIFGIRVKVINESLYVYENEEYYVGGYETSDEMDVLDKKLMTTKNNALCIITKNNLAVALMIENEFLNFSDLIIRLEATIYRNDKRIAYLQYDAYVCYKDDAYPDVPTIFITAEKNLKIEFEICFASYSSTWRNYRRNFRKIYKELEVFNFIFDHIHNLKNIPQNYAKVFLTRLNLYYQNCKDGSYVNIYRSDDKTICFIIATKIVEIFPHLEGVTKIYRSQDDPCNERKNKEYYI